MHILRTEPLSPLLVISGDQPQRSWVSDENKTGRDLILEVFFWLSFPLRLSLPNLPASNLQTNIFYRSLTTPATAIAEKYYN